MPVIELIHFEALAALRERAPPEKDRDQSRGRNERIVLPPDEPHPVRRGSSLVGVPWRRA